MPRLIASLLALAAPLIAVPTASAQERASTIGATARTTVEPGPAPGVQRLHYRFGPIHITPGQNTIEFQGNDLKPDVPGHIVRFKPDLEYADGTIPRVDVIHLHHGVWISNFAPIFAAGEEKTVVSAPDGYGWAYKPQDKWVMNHMIHNLTPTPTDVSITYDLDFIPAGTPADVGIQDVRTVWMDVVGGIYPVFDVHKGQGGREPARIHGSRCGRKTEQPHGHRRNRSRSYGPDSAMAAPALAFKGPQRSTDRAGRVQNFAGWQHP